ncbi:hypothetical protein D3C86_2108420 [compost metagenome]
MRILGFTQPEAGIGGLGALRVTLEILLEPLLRQLVIAGKNMAVSSLIDIALAGKCCSVDRIGLARTVAGGNARKTTGRIVGTLVQ